MKTQTFDEWFEMMYKANKKQIDTGHHYTPCKMIARSAWFEQQELIDNISSEFQAYRESTKAIIEAKDEHIARLEQKNKDMREVLEYYADMGNYYYCEGKEYTYVKGRPFSQKSDIEDDVEAFKEYEACIGGKRAREVLRKYEERI